MRVIIYDSKRGEVVDSATGLVLEDHIIDYGPEWRSYKPQLKRGEPLRHSRPRYLAELRGILPRIVIDDAEWILRKLKLGYGRAQVAAAVIFASKRMGIPIDEKLVMEKLDITKGKVLRYYRWILVELGPPDIDRAIIAKIIAILSNMNAAHRAIEVIKFYRKVREILQARSPRVLAAACIVKVLGISIAEASKAMGISTTSVREVLQLLEHTEVREN